MNDSNEKAVGDMLDAFHNELHKYLLVITTTTDLGAKERACVIAGKHFETLARFMKEVETTTRRLRQAGDVRAEEVLSTGEQPRPAVQ
jgi:hypothetical protein